jgi:hypothetical protein
MAWKKVVTESSAGVIAQEAATLTSQGALATLNTVDTAQIDASAIETAKINNLAVTNGKLADNAVDRPKLLETNTASSGQFLTADGQGTGFTWVNNPNTTVADTDTTYTLTAVDDSPSAIMRLTATGDGSGTQDIGIEDGGGISWATSGTSITPSLSLPSNHVTTARINNSAVTLAKMANLTANTLIGRDTESTGVPEELSVSAVKSMLSLNNVANTTDAGKPVSTAQAAAIAVVQADVDANESDADTAIALRAPIAGPTFTGTVTIPNLVVNGTTTTVNTATLTVEDENIVMGIPVSGGTYGSDTIAQTAVNLGGISLYTDQGGTESDFAKVNWNKDGQLTGWQAEDTHDSAFPISVMSFSTADATGNGAGVGSFHYDTSGDNLWLRTS